MSPPPQLWLLGQCVGMCIQIQVLASQVVARLTSSPGAASMLAPQKKNMRRNELSLGPRRTLLRPLCHGAREVR